MMAGAIDLEDLVHLEQIFYDSGYKDGFAHGRIHGLIEGRALGREKGFEIWEEIGFYQGFAETWKAIYDAAGSAGQRVVVVRTGDDGGGGGDGDDQSRRAIHHIHHLLDLIRRFPMVNPSEAAATERQSPSPLSSSSSSSSSPSEDGVDISKLQSQIRSRYKALCATLGVRQRPTLSGRVLTNVVRDANVGDVTIATTTAGNVVDADVDVSAGGLSRSSETAARRDNVWPLLDSGFRSTAGVGRPTVHAALNF